MKRNKDIEAQYQNLEKTEREATKTFNRSVDSSLSGLEQLKDRAKNGHLSEAQRLCPCNHLNNHNIYKEPCTECGMIKVGKNNRQVVPNDGEE